MISLICFEMINLFYNLSLHKVAPKKKEGQISNLGWAFGYFGGLCSLAIIFLFGLATTLTRSPMIGFLDVLPVFIVMTLAIGMMLYEAFFANKK